ncbi:MAG: hypothetical protein L0I79_04615, partial [Atopostipes sp.]|nr:hypothetical protein [Atopostipes sp.]
LNEYISQDGTKRSSNQVSGKFFNRITIDEVKRGRGPKAVATVESVVEGIKDELDQDGLPSGNKKLSAFNVDFFGELRENSKPVIPFEAIVPENLADAFDDLYDTGDTGKFSLKINNYAEEATEEDVQEVSGFGSTEELQQVKRNFVNNLEVIGGTEAYQEPRAYNDEQIAEAKQFRQKAIDALEDSYVPTETPSNNAFGQGSKTEEVKDKLNDEDLEDLSELDF